MRVRFTADFDWAPPERRGLVTLAYRASSAVRLVRRQCGEAAIAAGKAEAVAAKGKANGENPRG